MAIAATEELGQHGWLIDGSLREANLREADLCEAELIGANLSRAKLIGANLSRAKLIKVNLQGANLEGANLRGAKLRDADLREARLLDTNLQGTALLLSVPRLRPIGTIPSYADLQGANLQGANLSGATVTVQQLAQAEYLGGTTLPDGARLSEESWEHEFESWCEFVFEERAMSDPEACCN